MAGISALIGGIALLGFLVFLAGVGLVVVAASQQRPVRGGVILAIVGLAFGVLLSIISQGVIVLEAYEVAVVYNTFNGNLEETPRRGGTHIIMPIMQRATVYDTREQEYTMSGATSEGAQQGYDAISALTSDGQDVRIEVTVRFNVGPQDADILHIVLGNNYISTFVRPTVRTAIYAEVANHSAEDLYSEGRQTLQINAQTDLEQSFEEKGLILQNVLIREIGFSEEFSNAIEAKQTAEQNLERAETEAERILVEANASAEAVRAVARGDADAVVLAAEAQAEALRLISEQIAANPSLIQYEYIQNLSDNVGLILIPSNSPFLFDFNSISDLPEANPDFIAPIVPDTTSSEEGSDN